MGRSRIRGGKLKRYSNSINNSPVSWADVGGCRFSKFVCRAGPLEVATLVKVINTGDGGRVTLFYPPFEDWCVDTEPPHKINIALGRTAAV